jgi:hypothetical protein
MSLPLQKFKSSSPRSAGVSIACIAGASLRPCRLCDVLDPWEAIVYFHDEVMLAYGYVGLWGVDNDEVYVGLRYVCWPTYMGGLIMMGCINSGMLNSCL